MTLLLLLSTSNALANPCPMSGVTIPKSGPACLSEARLSAGLSVAQPFQPGLAELYKNSKLLLFLPTAESHKLPAGWQRAHSFALHLRLSPYCRPTCLGLL